MISTYSLASLALIGAVAPAAAQSGYSYSLIGWGRPQSELLLTHGPLNSWWRCNPDITWGTCNTTNLAIRTEPLNECGTVELDWNSVNIPKANGLTFRLLAFATWPYDKNGSRFLDGNITLPTQEFLTPSTSLNWTMNYPAGTEITLQLDAYSNNTYYRGSYNTTVQTGSTECTPSSHKPVFIDFPNYLQECENALVTWSGGAEPTEVQVTFGHPGWYFVNFFPIMKLGEQSYVEWSGNLGVPAGSQVEFGLKDVDGNILGQKQYLMSKGSKKCFINRDYRVHRWWRQPAAIAGLTIGGVAALLALGAGAFFGRRYWKRRYSEGAISLPTEAGEH